MLKYDYTILGKDTKLSINDIKTKLNNNVIVEGTSGCGKTRSVVIPNILNLNASYVVVDAKGIIYTSTNKFMRKNGYNVKVLNLRDFKDSSHFNPFAFIHTEQDIRRITEVLTSKIKDMKDPYWQMEAANYLDAYIYTMMLFNDKKYRNFEELFRIKRMYESDDYKEYGKLFRSKFNSYFEGSKIYETFLNKFEDAIKLKNTQNTDKCVLSMVDSCISMFNNEELLSLTSKNDFDFTELGKEKTIYYVITSDTDRSMDSLASIFFDIAFQELVNYADSLPKQRLKVPVRFIMDDFATNITVSNNFPALISSIRSRNISTMIIIQNIGQLKSKFGFDAETVIGNNSTYIYMGNNDITSAQRIAEYTMNLNASDILKIPYNEEIIMINGKEPIIEDKYNLEDHPNYKYLDINKKIKTYKKENEFEREVI